jgi:16S rRNA (guanine966-N2)-methyltransferase
MRITGGRCKGRRLSLIKGLRIRPSSDKIRETIFNLIGQDNTGNIVLDLFAGTGSLGLEALSRGALRAVFIDNARASIETIQKNLILCGLEESSFIVKWNLKRGLPDNPNVSGKRFDLVFIDPPYRKDLIPHTLSELSKCGVLASSSRIIAESLKDDILPNEIDDLYKFDERFYGDTKLSLYKYKEK